MENIKSYIIKFYITFILIVLALVLCSSTYASTSEYTDVFDDLRVDETFKAENYPNMSLEHYKSINEDADQTNDQPFMEVITVSESSSKELYIYVYQPTHMELDIEATAISMSIGYSKDGQDLKPEPYNLKLVSTYSVFDKYVVLDYEVSEDVYRYYNIVTLYRNYDANIDDIASGSETDGYEIGMSVGQQWCAYYENDSIVYEMGTFNTLEIEISYTGNFEFASGLTLGNFVGSFQYGHSWFVAFNCDEYAIKHIYDADLSYKKRSVNETWALGVGTNYEYGEFSDDIIVTLKHTDVASYQGDGLRAKKYTWNRISSALKFIENAESQDINITDECKKQLMKSQWVFAFTETELSSIQGDGFYQNFYSDIEDVTILRIHFMDVNDDVYNLGVVSDRVNPDNIADGNGSGLDLDFFNQSFEKIMMLIAIIVLLILLSYITPVLNLLGIVFKAIWYVLTLPFKLIGKLFKRRKY